MSDLYKSFAAGYGCLAAWADLLDRINVFPVADGDTGTNLRISLAPLRDCEQAGAITLELLARCAAGNSGNCGGFFSGIFPGAKLCGPGRKRRTWTEAGLAGNCQPPSGNDAHGV